MSDLPFLIVFAEGVASFLSPCILPLMPVYLSYLVGSTIEDEIDSGLMKKKVLVNTLGFILGLFMVFGALGAASTLFARLLIGNARLIGKISGAVIILFGLHHTGILRLKKLEKEKRIKIKAAAPGFFRSVAIGMAFSFGWTPCIGPILGSVLLMAGSTGNMLKGLYLLSIYSLGFSVPFLLLALFYQYLLGKIPHLENYLDRIKVISGLLLIILGILLYADKLSILY
jgi:cytochrome c-type biogenesis protein